MSTRGTVDDPVLHLFEGFGLKRMWKEAASPIDDDDDDAAHDLVAQQDGGDCLVEDVVSLRLRHWFGP